MDINEKLYFYVDKGDIKNINKLLNEGANATKVTSYGRSCVGQATFKGYSHILKTLLKSCEEAYISFGGSSPKKPRKIGMDIDLERTPDGMDGLQWDDEMQDSTAIINADDEWSRLYTYYARMFEQTGELLANTVKLKDPHCLDAYHQAPIHYAAVLEHVDCLNILLSNGSPVDVTTQNGVTPLHLAVKNENIIEILLKNKADPNRKIYNTGETALHVAAKMGNVKVVEHLLQSGSNINAANNKGHTPVMIAICNNNNDVANFLIQRNAKINLQDDQGYTAIYFAGITNNFTLTKLLLEKGARPFVTHYLLHTCIENNFIEIAQLLVKSGENVNLKNFSGHTPLHLAIKKCNDKMIDFLMRNGAQKFGRDIAKELHVAVQNAESIEQFIKVAKVLFHHGISIDDDNYWGETPLMTAIMLEQYKIANYLIREGADVNKGRNLTIVDNFLLARSTSNLNLLKLLVNAGLKLSPKPNDLKQPPWTNIEDNFEDWLAHNCRNPLSLQCLSRIKIRQILAKNCPLTKLKNSEDSRMLKLIKKLQLPIPIEKFLYEFDDFQMIK